jgi:ribosomal protein S18 acetylase RimI-like enzyme
MAHRLRRAVPDDAEGVAAASLAAWQGSYRGIVDDNYLDAMTLDEQVKHWHAYSQESETWVAEEDGRIVGYVTFGPTRDVGEPVGTAEVIAINVDPAAQGRGIGGALLQRAAERLAERGFERWTLWVLEANERTRRFYEHHGWEPDGAAKQMPFGRPTTAVRYRRAP